MINCKHYPMTFIPGFSTIKGEPQDPEENEKTYAESQQQRALERKLREEKRDLEVMKAQGAPEEQIKAQQQRVRSASAEIDDFCDETGRTRRRNRESAPTRATWPDEQGRVERYQGGYTPAPPSGPDDGGNPPSPANIHLGPDNIPPAAQAQAMPQEKPQEQPKPEKRNGPREMTADERDAVESYVSGENMDINQRLRGRQQEYGELTAEDRELVRDMDSALDVPLGKKQTLYRSVDAEAVFGRLSQIDYESIRAVVVYGDNAPIYQQAATRYIGRTQGKTITELGYMSTTTDPELAFEWGGFTGSDKPIVLRLNAPASTHGRDLSQFEVEGQEQHEVLLARGQKYRVTGIKGENGSIVVHADILEQ